MYLHVQRVPLPLSYLVEISTTCLIGGTSRTPRKYTEKWAFAIRHRRRVGLGIAV